VQLQKLREAGYIDIVKRFRDNYPLTVCHITPTGEKAFRAYVRNLQTYLKP
jgi:DNA-binding PadR family transcriptional regulator